MVANYTRPPWQPPNFKKGTVLAKLDRELEKDKKKQDVQNACARAKARDLKLKPATRGCRWIHDTPEEIKACRVSSWREAMHYKDKSTDPQLATDDRNVVTGCPITHQGPGSIHDKKKRFVLLDPKERCAGPLACEKKIGGKWVEIGRESRPGIPAIKRGKSAKAGNDPLRPVQRSDREREATDPSHDPATGGPPQEDRGAPGAVRPGQHPRDHAGE